MMSGLRCAVVFAAFACVSVSAQNWARDRLEKSSRHQEWVYLKHSERTVDTFVVYPEVSQKTPVIVVIHGDQGLTDWVQCLADELAEAGYIAIAPDLLSGMGPKGGGIAEFATGTAPEGIRNLTAEQIKADLTTVADYAKKIPAANGKLAVAGFGWGAMRAMDFAPSRGDLAALYLFPEAITVQTSGIYSLLVRVVHFPGPDGFMQSGDAPGAAGDVKKAHDEAWERWKKLLASL